jgi:queuine tRNA-ribosyltransferase
MGKLFRMAECGGQTAEHSIDIFKQVYADDLKPVDAHCGCYACRNFSRAYLHHLFKVRELLAYRLATIHNIYFINSLVSDIRKSISDGSFLELKNRFLYDGKRR